MSQYGTPSTGPTAMTKYGPLAAVAALQLIVVLLVPSVGQGGTAAGVDSLGAAAGLGSTGAGTATGAVDPVTGLPLAGPNGAPGAGTGVAGIPGAPGAGGATAPGGAGDTGAGTASGPAAGDTKHCVKGRQYDPAIEPYAPPCVPGAPGSFAGNNGGATGPGVSAHEVRVTIYVPTYGATVDAINRATGSYYNAENIRQVAPAWEKFVNTRYQLYGRSLKISVFQGTCSMVPPETSCLLPEMAKMVAETKPYAVVLQIPVCSACFTELARRGVVSVGAVGFSDALMNANAPHMYGLTMSSTKTQQAFAKFWCGQMTSKGGSGRAAVYAGAQNPAQDFRNKPRQLGVIASNDPDMQNTVRNVLYPALREGCGDGVDGHEYFYASDVSTASQQSQAGVARMNTAQNPATSVLCLCDVVAPQFVYGASANNNYWPEALVASERFMDEDAIAQSYDEGLACPEASRGCTFDGALGLGTQNEAVPQDQLSVVKVTKAGGGSLPMPATAAQDLWDSMNQVMSLIQHTGPQLTADRMQAAAPRMGIIDGGPGGSRRGYAPGDWSWVKDIRLTYWSKNKPSVSNGQPGRYFTFGGKRFLPNEIPSAPQPAAPLVGQR